jgi:two-component system response regulator RpfG
LFDPRCIDALLRARNRLEDICERYQTATARPGVE